MSKRQFVSTILWLIFVNLIIKAFFVFGIDLQVQNRVGQSAYGLYFTLLNLCYIFQIINDFGLNLLHNTDTAAHGKVRVERWQQILRLKVMLSLLYALVIAGAAYALGYEYAWNLLIWLVVNNILVSFISVFRAGISGTARYKAEAFISVLDKLLMIVICGALLLRFSSFEMQWFVWAQTASLTITVLVAWWLTNRHIDRTVAIVNRAPMKIIFRATLPFTLATLLMFIYTRSDSILIEKLLPDGVHQVGIYAAGYRFLEAANMLAFLFTPLLIPMYARLMKDRVETMQLIRMASGMMICMTACISLTGFWWGREIMAASYQGINENWVLTFRLLILSHIPIGLMYVFGSYLTATGQLKHQNILFSISMLISISVNFILIPIWGTVGAAITTLITQSLTTLGLIILGQYHLKVKTDPKRLINILIYFGILVTSGWVLESSTIPWMVEIVMFLFVGLFSAFLFKLLRWEAVRQMMDSYTPFKR